MQEQIKEILERAEGQISIISDLATLQNLRVEYLGKKGELTGLLRTLGSLSAEDRLLVGGLVNEAKDKLEVLISQKLGALKNAELEYKLATESLDVTLPSTLVSMGHLHPIIQTQRLMENIFYGMGFSVKNGPEIEYDEYNFERLNLLADHPARDMQETFFIKGSIVLRTHTSSVQARTLAENLPNTPVRIIAPGKVFRRDYDATHSPMFHQMEGLLVDEGITFGDLKGMLEIFCKSVFGEGTKVRFRPSFFPFTEPSAEVDISCVMCHGNGCRMCSHTGWLEILGSGMVHPNVLRMGGYDPGKMTGVAFGMGIERIAMLRLKINDIRLFYENDLRFLSQF